MSANTMRPRTRTLPAVHPALAAIWERLQQQYAVHQCSAPFWSAYQDMQQELLGNRPQDAVRLCNAMAGLAERLGAVPHAQLLHTRPAAIAYAGSTPR